MYLQSVALHASCMSCSLWEERREQFYHNSQVYVCSCVVIMVMVVCLGHCTSVIVSCTVVVLC